MFYIIIHFQQNISTSIWTEKSTTDIVYRTSHSSQQIVKPHFFSDKKDPTPTYNSESEDVSRVSLEQSHISFCTDNRLLIQMSVARTIKHRANATCWLDGISSQVKQMAISSKRFNTRTINIHFKKQSFLTMTFKV